MNKIKQSKRYFNRILIYFKKGTKRSVFLFVKEGNTKTNFERREQREK